MMMLLTDFNAPWVRDDSTYAYASILPVWRMASARI